MLLKTTLLGKSHERFLNEDALPFLKKIESFLKKFKLCKVLWLQREHINSENILQIFLCDFILMFSLYKVILNQAG